MSDVKQSRTAQGVCAERAILAEMGALADPFARGMLNPSMTAILRFVQLWPQRMRARSVTLAGLAARVLWHDAQVAGAIDAAIDQIVVVGAGYDSRAWRLRKDGVRFFELDHRATQQDKVRRAPGPGPTYVEADLTNQNSAEALIGQGFDASRPALFVLEGVTMYLSEEIVRQRLSELAAASATGSRLAVDFHPPPDAGTARDHRHMRLQRLARGGSGETLRLLVDGPHAVTIVEASGWVVNEETSMREAARALVPREGGLPVDAVNQYKTLVAGSHP